jgi:hypothetical protein
MKAVHLSLPGGGDSDDDFVELVELDADTSLWGGSRGDREAYGSAAEVIADLAERPPGDDWVCAAAAALVREPGWGFADGWRRPFLEVVPGRGEVFHATAAVNRASIRRHGLDWRQMGPAPGIAGSAAPELPAVFVCADMEEISFFLRMARMPSDVWSVQADGLWLETGPSGWWVINNPVGAERLRLVATDIPAHTGCGDG